MLNQRQRETQFNQTKRIYPPKGQLLFRSHFKRIHFIALVPFCFRNLMESSDVIMKFQLDVSFCVQAVKALFFASYNRLIASLKLSIQYMEASMNEYKH